MLADLFAYAVLASFVLLPLTLRIGGRDALALFDVPNGTTTRYLFFAVVGLQASASVAWLIAEPRVLGEPLPLWKCMFFLA